MGKPARKEGRLAHDRSERNRDKRRFPRWLRGGHPRRHRESYQDVAQLQSAWVKDMNILMEDGQIRAYKVNLLVTFVLEDAS